MGAEDARREHATVEISVVFVGKVSEGDEMEWP